jgi:hypothetical protein
MVRPSSAKARGVVEGEGGEADRRSRLPRMAARRLRRSSAIAEAQRRFGLRVRGGTPVSGGAEVPPFAGNPHALLPPARRTSAVVRHGPWWALHMDRTW